jgi:hypothetical protein
MYAGHPRDRLDAPVPGLVPLGFGDPPGVLLAVGERHAVEDRLGLRVRGQRRGQGCRYLNLPGRAIEFERYLDLITGRHPRTFADLAGQADQELAAHPGHAGSPGVAVHGGDHREPPGSLADRRDLIVIEHDGGRRATRLQQRAELDPPHGLILPDPALYAGGAVDASSRVVPSFEGAQTETRSQTKISVSPGAITFPAPRSP